MKKARNPKVGDVIQFPSYCFAPQRKGLNGWHFSAGIIEKLYVSKSGIKCATVRYCTKRAGRYQLLPNEEIAKSIKAEFLFEYDLEFHAERIREFLEIEKSGEQICWSEDAALLVNHNLV